MTIRLFRRKAGATDNGSSKGDSQAIEPKDTAAAKRPTRRGRRGSGSSKRAATAEALAPAVVTPQPAAEAPGAASRGGRTRRGRRGGARRKPGQQVEANASALPVPMLPEILPLDGRPATMEQLVEAQLQVMRGLQGSLQAMDSRLATMTRLGAEKPRIGIFVDVPNIMYAADRLKITLDYSKLLQLLLRGRELVRANAYAPISDDPQEPLATQRFVQPFIGHG